MTLDLIRLVHWDSLKSEFTHVSATNAMFVCLPDHSLLEVSNEVLALLLIQILTTIGLLWGEKKPCFFPLKKKEYHENC